MSEQSMDKSKPLSVEEMTEAAAMFLERYQVIATRMGPLTKPADILAVMESVAKLGHSLRAKKVEDARLERFGFNK